MKTRAELGELRVFSLFSSAALNCAQGKRRMKTLIFLTALVALVAAFDFPEEWEAWKTVN